MAGYKKERYLLIYEDMSLQIVNHIDDFDLDLANQGVIVIVDLDKETYIALESWEPIQFVKRKGKDDYN